MANFTAGWGGFCSLKLGATQLNLPMLSGSAYAVNQNRTIEMLAQGSAANAFPINDNPGITTSSLYVATRAFPGWFTAANLNTLFVTRDATYGDLSLVDMKFSDGTATPITDTGKAAGLRISANSDSLGPVDVGLSFLGTTNASAASFTAYAAIPGAPYYYADVQIMVDSNPLDLVHSFDLALGTGARYAKWFDALTTASNIDPGILSGALSITERPHTGALYTLTGSQRIDIWLGPATTGVQITLWCKLISVGHPVNTGGAVVIPSTWQVVSADGSAPVAFAARPVG